MKKEECIERYGEEAWEKHLAQRRAYYKANKEADNVRTKRYNEEHLEEMKAHNQKASQEQGRKGGKYYAKHLIYDHTGLRGDRNRIRMKHAKQYKQYKDIIAPDSQLHHEWIPETDEYRGIALVEADKHMHGFVDVIEILDGKITLLTEEEVKRGKRKMTGWDKSGYCC